MSRQVWKFALRLTDSQCVVVPRGIQPLCVRIDAATGGIAMWGEVDTENKDDLRAMVVTIVATGHPIPAAAQHYLGTVQMGLTVWHVYRMNM